MSGTEDPKASEPGKIEKLADEAVEAGKKLRRSRAGQKVAEVTDPLFEKAEQLTEEALASDSAKNAAAKARSLADEAVEAGQRMLQSEQGQKIAEFGSDAVVKVQDLSRKALDTDLGREAQEAAGKASDAAKAALKTELGKSMAVGAAAGAVLAIPIPFVGPVLGGALGAVAGAWRVFSKKS